MKDLIFDLEGDIIMIEETTAKLDVILEDLGSFYFEALKTEKNFDFHRIYFEGAGIRKKMADDYTSQLKEFINNLYSKYKNLFEASRIAIV